MIKTPPFVSDFHSKNCVKVSSSTPISRLIVDARSLKKSYRLGNPSFNLETAVQDDKVMQNFDLESLTTGGDHSLMVKPPPVVTDSHSKDCVNLSSSTAVSRFNALHQVNLQIYAGELVAIMGPSGSGKSTLMHILGCLDKPSEGSYLFNGNNVYTLNDKELSILRATQIGFIFQSFNLIAQLNVYENIEVPFLYHPTLIPPKERKERILSSIERVGLQHRLHHLPSQLSGGESQRVAIARALAINPLLILADEPTGNLDSETGETILHLFQELNRQGTTCVVVTHDSKVAAHCQRIIYMKDGSIIRETGVKNDNFTQSEQLLRT